jgi:hypothetical protein
MRRTLSLLTVAALVLVPVVASAQPAEFGVKGALAFATLPQIQQSLGFVGSNYEPQTRVGLALGGFGTWRANDWFALQPELLYVQKGVTLEGPAANPVSFVSKIDYLEVPILARLTPPASGEVRPYLFAGPTFGIKVRGRVERMVGGVREKADAEALLRDGDAGVTVGAGTRFGRFLAETRFTQGLTRVNKDVPDFQREVKNRTVALLAGFTF